MSAKALKLTDVENMMADLVGLADSDIVPITLGHLQAGGSRVRAKLCLSASNQLGITPNVAVPLAAAAELLHNASLVHDDLQDRDRCRRNQPAIWFEYGDDAAVLAGDLLLSAAYGALGHIEHGSPKLSMAMHCRVAAVIAGQHIDVSCSDVASISEQKYMEVAAAKSGPLLALPLDLPLIFAGRSDCLPQVTTVSRLFAQGYQMADDLEDAEQDFVSGEMNIVSILAATGDTNPRASSMKKAADALVRAAKEATELPNRCAQMIEIYVSHKTRSLLEQGRDAA